MSEPTLPQLRSMTVRPGGRALSLRVLLPPNLANVATRGGKISVKIEANTSPSEILPPERLGGEVWEPEPGSFLAALLIESWCDGRIPSILQLDAARLSQLLQPLANTPNVFWLKEPQQPIRWDSGELPGVHTHLRKGAASAAVAQGAAPGTAAAQPTGRSQTWQPQTEAGSNLRQTGAQYQEPQNAAHGSAPAQLPPMESGLAPLEVDGSLNFLALRLPSRESALHPHALALVKDNGFQLEPSNGKWWLRDRHKTLQFLADHMQALRSQYRARFTDNFTERTRSLRFASIEVDIRSTTPGNSETFELEIALRAKGLDEGALQQALEKGQCYVEAAGRNAESAVILVPRNVREQAASVQQALGTSQGLRCRVSRRIRKEEVAATQAILQQLQSPAPHSDIRQAAAPAGRQRSYRSADAHELDDTPAFATKPPALWLELSRALDNPGALPPCPAPQSLSALLRPYQRIGAAWLWHLYRNGLGGILADEMGLGKTVQCLAFIAAATDAKHSVQATTTAAAKAHSNVQAAASKPSLIVCPASLVENWRREAEKFTPALRVFCHHGDSRLADAHAATQYDLILTSYATLAKDRHLFETIDFLIAAGDEAQHIKNAKTLAAQAMRSLRAGGRFLLTGTPVENDIRELESLFAFILPGYLANRQSNTAALHAAEDRRAVLVARAAPYILRRMKRTVAADLPEKIEQTIYCELGAEQRAFYRQVQETARRQVQALELGGAGDNRVRFAAFTELLRLRQACIDPQLVQTQEPPIASAKREALLELVQEAVEGGHRLLVFSQFTSALKLVAEDLDVNGIRHFYLDGQTRDRTALCERFNADESVSAFLISLRAGGTGLNLTGADTVIHLDPWWNPAAQAQATDRAHRIGQSRVVTVYQLIAAQTVEEQVLTLQREKSALLEQLLDASDTASAQIGIDDLKALIG